jgi:hypothetical protein
MFIHRKRRGKVPEMKRGECFFAGEMEKILNQAVLDVFMRYATVLLHASRSYIVHAIWGIGENGDELDAHQSRIHHILSTATERVLNRLLGEHSGDVHRKNYEQLLNELVTFRLYFMLEHYKNCIGSIGKASQQSPGTLLHMPSMGNA